MDQQPLAVWLLNSEVIGASAFRLYFIFLGAKTAHPERRSHHFTRGDLARLTKLSANTLKKGLQELKTLNIVLLDSFDLQRTMFIVNDVKDYNWTEIKRRQGLVNN